MSYYAVYQTASGEFSWCRIPSNITVFSAAYRYASRVAGSDKLVSIVTSDVLQFVDQATIHLWDRNLGRTGSSNPF